MDGQLFAAIAIVIVVERIADKAFEPIRQVQGMPAWLAQTLRILAPYVVWLLAGVAVWFTEINLFEQIMANPLAGRIMTAVLAGGGSSLLQDIKDDLSHLPRRTDA